MPTRSEHRRSTLLKLSNAAVDLFEQKGHGVTIDAIAAHAQVSRRTVFRYVDSKEELAFIHPLLWFDVFENALTDCPSEPIAERLRVASRAIALHIDEDPDPPRRAFAVVSAHPELLRGFSGIYQRWIGRVTQEVLTTADDPEEAEVQFRARVIGAAVMGMVDAVTRRWVFASPEITFTDLYDEGFAVLSPLLTR